MLARSGCLLIALACQATVGVAAPRSSTHQGDLKGIVTRGPVAEAARAALAACTAPTRPNVQTELGEAAPSGTTSFILDGNRVYADLEFVLPDSSTHRAYAYVDMGSRTMQLSAPLYDSLGVGRGMPARFAIGGLTVSVPASQIERGGRPTVRPNRPAQLEATIPAWVLQRYVVVIDYAQQTLTLGAPGSIVPCGTGTPIRVDTVTGLSVVDATINGTTYPVTIDNGSAYTWFRQDVVRQWLRAHPRWERGVGAVGAANMMLRGEEPERNGILVRVPDMRIGGLALAQVGALGVAGGRGADSSLALMDWYSTKNVVPVLGWIGGNVLVQFRLTIDYPHRTMYWLREADPDTTDLHQIGLTLRTRAGGVYVAAVATKNGRPTVQGVEPGDQLISAGGHVLTSGTLGQIFASMHGEPGATRELVLERNGARYTVVATITAF
jgi:hypothetical protein